MSVVIKISPGVGKNAFGQKVVRMATSFAFVCNKKMRKEEVPRCNANNRNDAENVVFEEEKT